MELERFEEKILALLRAKQYLPLQRYLETLNPADVAECLDDLLDEKEIDWEEDLPRIFRLLPKELASDVFAEMEPELQSKLIDAFSDKELGEVRRRVGSSSRRACLSSSRARYFRVAASRCLGSTRASRPPAARWTLCSSPGLSPWRGRSMAWN